MAVATKPGSTAVSSRTSESILPPIVPVAPPGKAIRINWAGVSGATAVEVDPALVTIGSATVEKSLGDLSVATQDAHRVITVPAGQLIRSLTLKNLKLDDASAAPSSSNLKDRRLAIAVVDASGKPGPPLFAVPPVPQRGLLPASLTGASYENTVLHLPDVAAAKLRLTLVQNNFPEEFAPVALSLDSVSGVAAVLPRDLQLIEPDGVTVMWSFPGAFPAQAPPASVDIGLSIRKVFTAALKAGQPLDATFHLVGADPSQVHFQFSGASGALVRTFPGSVALKLRGDPGTLALSGAPLDSQIPSAVTADVTVKYTGIRILEDISDTLPASGGIVGQIVGQDPVLRPFPPRAFDRLPLARVGLIGRAPVECELSVQFADVNGVALGRPGVAKVKPDTQVSSVWIDLPPLNSSTPAVALSVRANQGRFFWAGESVPLASFAVNDPDPGGRPLKLNGSSMATVTQGRQVMKALALPPAGFRSTAPALASSLFLDIDFSSLSLRYPR